MAATSRGIVALQGKVAAEFIKSRSRSSSSLRSRSFMMPSSKSFRGFRTIKKLPKLNRSASRSFVRISTAVSAMQADQMNYFMSKDLQEDDVLKKFDNDHDEGENAVDEDDSTSTMVDTVNAVLAEIVDVQKYIKETGRTTPRPMKRRALVVALALSAFRGPLDDVDIRLGTLRRAPSASRLSRTPSATGFARTTQLISQLSFRSPHNADMH